MTRIAGLIAVLLLSAAGCAGSADPTRFYVLAPADPAGNAGARPASERDLRQAVPMILAENLSRLVPTEQVMVFPWGRAFAPDAQVIVEISRLEGAVGGESVLAARWRILSRSGEEVTMGTARLTEPSGPDYESLVAAQSRLVGALSRDIAAALRSGVQARNR